MWSQVKLKWSCVRGDLFLLLLDRRSSGSFLVGLQDLVLSLNAALELVYSSNMIEDTLKLKLNVIVQSLLLCMEALAL